MIFSRTLGPERSKSVVLPDDVVDAGGGRIVLVVMDGLGGLPDPATGRTECETAATPNLDRLSRQGAIGLHQPVAPGITPGSGPGHLALFGYDPIRYNIGRGVLSALGVGFELEHGDVAIRLNFATIDGAGLVTDRRAGRPSDTENKRLVEKLRAGVAAPGGVRIFFEAEKEHRAVLILRGENISADLEDTDPQETGVPPHPVRGRTAESAASAKTLQTVLDAAFEVLSDEPQANALLMLPAQSGAMRPVPGWASHRLPIPGLYQTGSTTHPGGSVSAGPGRNAAWVLLDDLGMSLQQVIG
jgi:2,3-bisphosphoglycerate-independent phosphoglycerate mutase